ncbi:DUF3460 family protein [Achromobacter sp. Marseille-Q0513]|uniref:DUF3460 family protein n=1 Tax=Achromobacter sp. Marseille-Q0513 TaxID=2829161 RepID=UPI001B9A0A26|nr:DUF3460 family protein [Achromobacter sp. Marseille-Q0513]
MSRPTTTDPEPPPSRKDYKKSHPGTEERQREGRARLWDKPQDQELQEGFRAARVPQRPYVYQAD